MTAKNQYWQDGFRPEGYMNIKGGQMTAKHTPGPWKVTKLSHVDDQLWLQITGPDGRGPIVRINSPGESMADGVIAESKLLITPEDNQWANARLIAAAPEMLTMLKEILEIIDYEGEINNNSADRVIEDMRTIIRKARGE